MDIDERVYIIMGIEDGIVFNDKPVDLDAFYRVREQLHELWFEWDEMD